MKLFSAAFFLAASTVSATADCKLENWKYEAAGGGTMFTYIQGSTSCRAGTIIIRAFDGERYIGNTTAPIRGHAFKAVMQVTAPKRMSIKYVIER